jgi:hypothetical protein
MARISKKLVREYLDMAKENEALWALVAVIAMTVIFELYQKV